MTSKVVDTAVPALAIEAAVSKHYGPNASLADAKIIVRPGTVHALVGENGAGKSTLVKILAGVVRADAGAGTLVVDGKPVELATWDRRAARAAGIGIVQQHGSSAGTLSVVENAVLGTEPARGPLVVLGETATKLRELGDRIGLPVDPFARTEDLPLGAAQRAEIVAALYHGASILILDEPTAVLAPVEVTGLLETLRRLASEGKTIIIVTHKLDEVHTVADDVTVLRAGATVATMGNGEPLEVAAIARAMVGEDLPPGTPLEPPPASAPSMLVVTALTVPGALADVSVTVRRGELVGVAGVDGNGQRELALAIAGLVKSSGAVRIGDRDVARDSPARRLAAGLAHVPEDRLHGGLVLDATVAENLALNRRDVTGRWQINRAAVRVNAVKRIAELDIRPADSDAIARQLSGGNQQKVVVARELSRPNLRAVVASQPTRGVDLGAVSKIHARLRGAAKSGAGVLVISADLDELLALCHRIVVLLRGKLVGEVGGEALRGANAREQIGLMMTGGVPGTAGTSVPAESAPATAPERAP
ncbi:MAG: ATP-binding cassette domain-containing protein [Deltaproteobacteria bacterium]|nr:ATP-binding cassette domain-containing protein [Deltaproteobacteria bacterium]